MENCKVKATDARCAGRSMSLEMLVDDYFNQ